MILGGALSCLGLTAPPSLSPALDVEPNVPAFLVRSVVLTWRPFPLCSLPRLLYSVSPSTTLLSLQVYCVSSRTFKNNTKNKRNSKGKVSDFVPASFPIRSYQTSGSRARPCAPPWRGRPGGSVPRGHISGAGDSPHGIAPLTASHWALIWTGLNTFWSNEGNGNIEIHLVPASENVFWKKYRIFVYLWRRLF